MPKELVVTSLEKAELREYENPPLKEGQVRVETEGGAAKHGTELAVLKGYAGARGPLDREWLVFEGTDGKESKPPSEFRPGNMYVGRVSELGPGAKGLKEGDRALAYGTLKESHVLNLPDKPNAMADGRGFFCVPDDLDWRGAVCLDPSAFALGALRDGGFKVGDSLAVFGLGAIGLMAVQLGKIAGASVVIGIDPLEGRRNLAKKLGAGLVIDPTKGDTGLEAKKASGQKGIDVCVDYSGSVPAIQAALRSLAVGGTLVCGSFSPPFKGGLDFGAEAHLNLLNIVFTRSCTEPNREHPRWDEWRIWGECWRLIKEGRIVGEGVVDPVVSFGELPGAFVEMVKDPSSSVKLGVKK